VVTILRPLSTSELLDRTFHLYRNNFLVFVGITAIPQLLILALRIAIGGRLNPGQISTFVFASWGIALASLIAAEIAHAATVIAVSNFHLDRPATVGSSYSSAKGSLFRVVWISVAVLVIPVFVAFPVLIVVSIVLGITFATAGGGGIGNVAFIRVMSVLAVLIIPAVALRWWLQWSLVVPVTVLEGGGLRASMRRSKSLTKGSRGRIFLIYLLVAILGAVVSWLVQLPLLAATGFRLWRQPVAVTGAVQAISAAGVFLSTSLVGALGAIALTLIYYDQRVRKEGFDLQLMMSTVEGGAQSAAAAPA
jgi:hypothetical protein